MNEGHPAIDGPGVLEVAVELGAAGVVPGDGCRESPGQNERKKEDRTPEAEQPYSAGPTFGVTRPPQKTEGDCGEGNADD